jgi:hypothetical protein
MRRKRANGLFLSVLGLAVALCATLRAGQSTARAATATAETFYYFVFANPVAGQEARFNSWYNGQHQLDVVSVPGFVSARRFVFNELPLYREAEMVLPKYLEVYKVVTTDLDAVFTEVNRRLRTGETKLDASFDGATSVSYVYRALGPWITGAGGDGAGAKPGRKDLFYHFVFTPFVEGREDEFNAVYAEHHAPELAAIPGFTGAQRLILARPSNAAAKATKYAALFTVESSDLAAVKKGTAAPGTANPGQDFSNTRGYTYRAITPEVSGDETRARAAAQK